MVAPVATAYAEPTFNSAKVTEVVSGESVQILEQNKEWVYVQQDDGYKSWIRNFYGRFDDDLFPATHMVINKGKFPFGMRVKLIHENIITADGQTHSMNQNIKPLIQDSEPDKIVEISKNLLGKRCLLLRLHLQKNKTGENENGNNRTRKVYGLQFIIH